MNTDALKQAAIDAYMRSEGFDVNTDRDEDRYTDLGLVACSKVDKNGKGTKEENGGGMAPNPTYDLDYTSHFFDVRTRVDNALKPWQEDRLPKPSALNKGKVKAEAAVTALNVGNTSSFGGALGGYLKTISDNAPQFHGHAMDAFNNSFTNQLPAVISNHGCLAAVVVEAWGPRRRSGPKHAKIAMTTSRRRPRRSPTMRRRRRPRRSSWLSPSPAPRSPARAPSPPEESPPPSRSAPPASPHCRRSTTPSAS